MPGVNPLRSRVNESNLAQRIALEREARGWSYEGTASRMAAAGYPLQASAIFRIEKGEPPRRLTVDELVGFSKVFDTPIEDMLAPITSVKDRAATELLSEIAHQLTTVEAFASRARYDITAFMQLEGVSPVLTADLDQMLRVPTSIHSDYLDPMRLDGTELGSAFAGFVRAIHQDAVRTVRQGAKG